MSLSRVGSQPTDSINANDRPVRQLRQQPCKRQRDRGATAGRAPLPRAPPRNGREEAPIRTLKAEAADRDGLEHAHASILAQPLKARQLLLAPRRRLLALLVSDLVAPESGRSETQPVTQAPLSGSARAARAVHYANGMPRGSQLSGSDPLVLVYVLCVFAAALLIPALLCRFVFPPRPSDSDSDDGWGKGPQQPPIPPDPPRGGVPLDDAEPSQLRLRDHSRLAYRRHAGQRRRVQEPDRHPARTSRPGWRVRGRRLARRPRWTHAASLQAGATAARTAADAPATK